MMFLEKMRRFFSIFPVMSTSKAMKMAKTEFPDKLPRNSVFAKISIVVEWAMAFLEKKSVF